MKKLSELTTEEIRNLLSCNEWMKKQAQEYSEEGAQIVVDEVLKPFQELRGIRYNIGYPANYMDIPQEYYKEFLNACENHDYCGIFTEETARMIERAGKRAYFFTDCLYGYEDISNENYERLEKWIDEIVHAAAIEIVAFCAAEYENAWNDEVVKESAIMFCDCNDSYETDGKYIYETEVRMYA